MQTLYVKVMATHLLRGLLEWERRQWEGKGHERLRRTIEALRKVPPEQLIEIAADELYVPFIPDWPIGDPRVDDLGEWDPLLPDPQLIERTHGR